MGTSTSNTHKTGLILLAGFLLFLCGTGRKARAGDDRVLPLKVHVGEKAPNFSLPAGNGKTIWLSDFAGHNVLIDFYRGYW